MLCGGTAAAQPAAPAEPVYAVVDKMPRFYSTDSTTNSLIVYLGHNTRYPVDALIDKATGRVFVSFVVNKSGYVEQVKVVKGGHRALNKEALRVVSEMPRWEVPGRLQGQPVNVSFTVPITFNMSIATPAQARAIMTAQSQRRAAVQQQLTNAQTQLAQPAAPGGDVGPVFTADPLSAANYISRHVQYPLDAQRARREGVVLVAFVVSAEGAITDVRVTKGLFPSLDAEARRVVSSMPPWQPGTHEGKPTAVPFTDVPVTFRLR
ncbi:MAG: energy transducer TonB [Hymenobacter sp.]